MNSKALPSRLKKEPLIDAVCEIRFSSTFAVSDVLPGLLMAKFPNKIEKLERLPVSNLPEQIRNNDPNLMYQPLLRLSWGNFLILVGSRSIALASKLPYPGWTALKDAMMELVNHAAETGLFKRIERYSMKYVDIIEGTDVREMIDRVNLDLVIGEHRLGAENFSVRVELSEQPFLHVVQIVAPATTQLTSGAKKTGLIVDIDSVCTCENSDVNAFIQSLPSRLDDMHAANKRIFFSCLTEQTIEYLEPVYECV